MEGWMDCIFMTHSVVIQSYGANGRVIMKSCVMEPCLLLKRMLLNKRTAPPEELP